MAVKVYTCATCGAEFEHATKGRPRHCLACRKGSSRRRSLTRAEARGDTPLVTEARKLEGSDVLAPEAEVATRSWRLAAIASLAPPSVAAAIAGLPEDADVATELAAAREAHPELAVGDPGAVRNVGSLAITALLTRLALVSGELRGPAVATAINQAARALDLMQTGAQRVFSRIEVYLDGPASDDDDAEEEGGE